jgi:hypothetical protein
MLVAGILLVHTLKWQLAETMVWNEKDIETYVFVHPKVSITKTPRSSNTIFYRSR